MWNRGIRHRNILYFYNMPQTVEETKHSLEEGWLKQMKYMVMFQYLICDMHFGNVKSELVLRISVGIL